LPSYEIGYERALIKGIEQTKSEVIKNGLKNGVDIKILSLLTNMKEEEIKKIKEELEKK